MAFCIHNIVTDEKAELEGVWQDYEGGSRVKLARFNNEKAQRMRMEWYQENKALLEALADKGDEGEKQREELFKQGECKIMAEAVLLDWEGFEDLNGKTVKHSPKVAEQYLLMSKDFRKDMSMLSGNRDKYLLKNLQEDVEAAKKS
jgi:hypothetical protein